MTKEILTFAGGIVIGVAVGYGIYKLYKYNKAQTTHNDENDLSNSVKNIDKSEQKFQDLVSNQTYVELLTAKELTRWFREKRSQVNKEAKMVITIPTEQNMRGLGYPIGTNLDVNSNIIQMFYDDQKGEAILTRLVSYMDIDSNLQAKLLEQDGMLVVTD